MALYVDSSAFLKLLVDETESDALEAYTRGTALVTSVITLIELDRSIRRNKSGLQISIGDLFEGVEIRGLDDAVVASAGTLEPVSLRSLDAIHLASALDLRTELDGFVTYDARLAEAARAHRLPVVAPA